MGKSLPSVRCALDDEERVKRDNQDKQLLALFMNLLSKLSDDVAMEEALEELASLRAEYAISYAALPFNFDIDDVVRLLKSTNDSGLSDREKEEKKRIMIAVINLIDFSVCEEYQLMREVRSFISEHEEEDYEDYEDELIGLNDKYNSRYRDTEDHDFEYAMIVCRKWLGWGDDAILTYMTQGDDRVRPWHATLEGFSAPKHDYPGWLIPPIEWGCRCYLISESGDVVENRLRAAKAAASVPVRPKELDGAFSESICTGGNIVSDSHPYFTVNDNDLPMLQRISSKIRSRYM